MKAVSVNIQFLTQAYFAFDSPVPYKTKTGEIQIKPISLKDSMIFLYSIGLLNIDKNSLPDVEIIQMSYLQFICEILLSDKESKDANKQKFYNILNLCLGFKAPYIEWKNERTPILGESNTNIKITPKEFDAIKSIILHQNFPHFDDEYINPDLKKAMDETDELRNKGHEMPSLERKMAIVTAHCGLPKKEQMLMTLRSYSLLFEEVVGEVEFTTTRPVALAGGKSDKLEHWIFKKKKDKFDGYIQSVDAYKESIGGDQSIKTSDTSLGDSYIQQYNEFN